MHELEVLHSLRRVNDLDADVEVKIRESRAGIREVPFQGNFWR